AFGSNRSVDADGATIRSSIGRREYRISGRPSGLVSARLNIARHYNRERSGERGSRFSGSRFTGSWFWVLGSGFLVLGSWFWVLGSWFLVLRFSGFPYYVRRAGPSGPAAFEGRPAGRPLR